MTRNVHKRQLQPAYRMERIVMRAVNVFIITALINGLIQKGVQYPFPAGFYINGITHDWQNTRVNNVCTTCCAAIIIG